MGFFSKLFPPVPKVPNLHLRKDQANAAAVEVRKLFKDAWIMPVGGLSESMGFHLRVPCYAIIDFRWDSLKVGDTVLRTTKQGTTVHMASYHDGRGNWKTTGLANKRTDPGWMDKSTYLGTVIFSVPYKPEEKE